MSYGKKYIDAGVMTGTSVITGDPIELHGSDGEISFQNIWLSTAVGTFTWEVTNNRKAITNPTDTDVTWTTVTTPATYHGTLQPAGTAGSHVVVFSTGRVFAIRQKYTNSSSTGTLNTYIDGE